jgi:amino acid adenylation domain-containing protein
MTMLNFDSDPINTISDEQVFVFPASFAQQRLWFLDQLTPGNLAYNVPAAVGLKGRLHTEALERSLCEIISRHEILRTRFDIEDGQPVQVVLPWLPGDLERLPIIDLSARPETARKQEALRLADEEAGQVFDLSKGPLFKAKLLRLADEEHILLLTLHHIISDGWSVEVLVKELCLLYEAFTESKPSPLPPLQIQYADFAVWQIEYLQGEVLEKQLEYWMSRLKGASPVLELPLHRPRPAIQTFHGAHEPIEFPAELIESIKYIGLRENATLFMTLLAAFKVLLYRYTGQEDILVGSPIANRQRGEVQGLIGCFVNTLVLRTEMTGNLTFRELLRKERAGALEAYLHQDMPFEMLVERLNLDKDPSYNPIFQVMFLFQSVPKPPVELPGLELSYLRPDVPATKFDISLAIEDTGLRGFFEYNVDIFQAATMKRMADHLRNLLEAIAADPDQQIALLPMLTEAEFEQVLIKWNQTTVNRAQDRLVHQLFEAQAERAPDTVAVTTRHQSITFGELNRRANQLANKLRRYEVGPEVPVGICMERSIDWVVGLMGIFKAGGAQVLLDPMYPIDRLAFMMEDAKVPVLVSQKSLEPVAARQQAEVIYLDSSWEAIAQEPEETPGSAAQTEHSAYVVYTSGSTGRPKAVINTHGSLLNLVRWFQQAYAISPEDRAPQVARMGFDASVWELWTYLTAGASVHLLDEETWSSPLKLRDWFISKRLTIGFLPPALSETVLYETWPEDALLRVLLTGSDKAVIRPPAGLPFKYINCYGPTESAVIVTTAEILPASKDGGPPPIGRPISNTQIYLLDRYMQPVPMGASGELHIAGAPLARGYLDRPDLTAERFIPNPFGGRPGDRLYKTGDMARYLSDGTLEFLGRIDHQVKIRGFRIELGEIETLLCQHPAVETAAILVKEDAPGDKRLVAYVVPRTDRPQADELRDLLKKKLPDYMVPSAFVMLEQIPLTPNGKLDHRALEASDSARPETGRSYVQPRTDLEQIIAEVLQDVLQVGKVGLYDNFFDLGAHSLLIVRIRAALQERLGKEIPIVEMYKNPSINSLAKYIGDEQVSGKALNEGYDRASVRNTMRKRRKAQR